ncbi:MAG TPA: O-antigen ligase family protein [Bryobacteraceae bacterium]|nr:O-antigen ligase family protein [Bryobacteraceae bacterium]
MSSFAAPRRIVIPAGVLIPLFFGVWAAAIAVAPSLTVKAILMAPAVLVPLTWWTVHQPGRWLTLFFATALLLPPLPIPIGDSGPHPCLVFAALGIFAGMVWVGKWRVDLHGVGGALLTLWIMLLASIALAALNSGPEIAAGSLARVLLFAISVYVFFYAAHGPGTVGLAALYYFAVGSALFACVDFYFQFPAPAGYGPQFVWLDTGVFRRAQGFFYEASTLGNFCSFFLVMIAVAFSRPRSESPAPRKALIVGGVVFFAALVLSYSRGSLVNLLVAALVLVWVNRRRIPFARVAPVAGVFVAIAAFLTWKVFPTFAEMYWMRLSNTAEFFFTATNGVLSGRVASWRILLEWISMHPWETLIGIGYKTLPYTDYLGSAVVADNMYLSLLVETGIAGLAALLWLNFAILRAAAQAARSLRPRSAFCGTWMLCFWAGQIVQMFSGDLLTYWRVLPVYFFVLAMAVRE